MCRHKKTAHGKEEENRALFKDSVKEKITLSGVNDDINKTSLTIFLVTQNKRNTAFLFRPDSKHSSIDTAIRPRDMI